MMVRLWLLSETSCQLLLLLSLQQCLLAAVDGAALAALRDKLSAATAVVTPAAAGPAQPLLLIETSCQVYLLRPFLKWLFLQADAATNRDKL
jgi:hypothetical protein